MLNKRGLKFLKEDKVIIGELGKKKEGKMDEKEFEDFIKNWEKILESLHEMTMGVDAISNGIARKMRQNMKEIDSWLDPLRKSMAEYERNIGYTMDSIRGMGGAFANKMDEIGRLPEAMTKDIRECAAKLSGSMGPVLEYLHKLQERWPE